MSTKLLSLNDSKDFEFLMRNLDTGVIYEIYCLVNRGCFDLFTKMVIGRWSANSIMGLGV